MSHYSLEMSLSREEFLRLLPAAVRPFPVREEAGRFCGTEGERRWLIDLTPLPERRIGSVALPRHQVEIHLEGFSEQGAAAFLTRFHQGFQRGGG
jgi:hypothetical protein